MRLLRILIAVAVLLSASSASAAQKVMLCISDTAYGPDLRTRLLGTGAFASVDWVNCQTTTPSLATMKTYDAVLISSNGSFGDRVTLGNNLADYVDAGGYVVQTHFAMLTGNDPTGRWATDQYGCILAGGTTGSASLKSTPNEPTSPLVSGVSGLTANNRSTGALNATRGAVSVWDYNDGRPGICRMTIGGRPRVDLNFVPSTSLAFDVTAGDGTRLVKNALLFGAPPTLTVTPSPLNFSAPSGPVNGTLTVKNDSMVTLSVTAATISLNPTEFALVTPPTFPVALAPAASTTLTVRFTPSMNGTRNGELTLTSDGAVTTHTIPLKGVAGPPAIGIAYASFTFADTAVGASSAPVAKNIGNIGFNPLTISSITLGGSHPGDFSLSLPTFPAVVAPGTNLSISATFTPTAVGSRSATITIVSDDPYVPSKVIPFYGQGLAGDAGVVDAAADTRPADSAPVDSTTPDTTVADTTVADTTVADTTVVDTTVADTTVADTTVVDSSVADTAVVDSTVEDTNVEDTGIHEDTSTARADTATSEDADPIPAAAPASDEGCGCTTAGRSADRGAGLALLGLLLAAGRRRK